jgi:hypothetical protein
MSELRTLLVEHEAQRTPGTALTIACALPDGLYRVSTPSLCAGFVVAAGRVTLCAPILVRRFAYWVTVATRLDA